VIGIIFISQNNSGGLQVAGRKSSSGKEVTKIPAAKLIAGMTRPIRYIRIKYLKPSVGATLVYHWQLIHTSDCPFCHDLWVY